MGKIIMLMFSWENQYLEKSICSSASLVSRVRILIEDLTLTQKSDLIENPGSSGFGFKDSPPDHFPCALFAFS